MQRFETVHDTRQQALFPPAPVLAGDDWLREANIHVGILEQQVTLDDQLLGEALVDAAVEQACSLMKNVVTDANRVEGDVARHDHRGLDRPGHHFLEIVEAELFRPALDALVLAERVIVQHGALEGVQRQRDHRRAAVVFAALVGGSGKNAVAPAMIDYPLVLDHAALGKHHQLVPVQDFPRQERKQVR